MKTLIVAILLCVSCSVANALTVTIEIPKEIATDIVESFAVQYRYHPQMNTATEISKADFAKQKIKEYIRDVHQSWKLQELKAVRNDITDQAKSETDGITVN